MLVNYEKGKRRDMAYDFGPGMTIDELIDMRAIDIVGLALPSEKFYVNLKQAASILVERELAMLVLKELWEDGHSVWQDIVTKQTVVVQPTGQIKMSND